MDFGRTISRLWHWTSTKSDDAAPRHADPAGHIRWGQDSWSRSPRGRGTRARPHFDAAVTAERTREVAQILVEIRTWAAGQPDVRAVAVVGSWAHNRARMDSDVDLIVLCIAPERYLGDSAWSRVFIPDGVLMDTRSWGPLTELRFILRSRLEIDFGVAPLSWAAVDPIDDGTRAVVQDGISVLHDPDDLLAILIAACQPVDS